MRYFLTTNASLPVNTPAGSFIFEPVGQMGGSWFGVLAVADEAAASSLVGATNTDEITLEHYERVKKKTQHSSYSTGFKAAPVSLPGKAAEPAPKPTSPASAELDEPAPIGSVDLLTTTEQPPVEALLADAPKKKGRPK